MTQPRIRDMDLESSAPDTQSGSAGISQGVATPSTQSTSWQQVDPNPNPQNKRKQPPDTQQPAGASKRANTTGHVIVSVGSSEFNPPDPSIPSLRPKCLRISGIPQNWSENDLSDVLDAIDPSLTQNCRPSLYPACSGSTQTALLCLDSCPEYLQRAKHHQIPESSSRTKTLLTIDSDFYNLTPMNVPKGEIVADVIAVTGLAGHAFGSWRSRETQQMWLKDFLPHDVKNVRIMSYGYDSTLVGHSRAETRLLDYQRLFIQELECARTVVPKTRPLIFIGHSLGGILILQTLIEARRNPSHHHLLESLHSIVFFGTPHQGIRTYELEEMVEAESGGYDLDRETSKYNLLKQLREGSEFLEIQKEELGYIWAEYKPKIVSFYELFKTPTVGQVRMHGVLKMTGADLWTASDIWKPAGFLHRRL
ncbi:hypothetical protein K440DRAFT_18990 [Wilcoxina mikolae CBS 423.85]|nr:hypothetical protein K440DRAFT_18990 [Wilcoxina mikolae CBS 423.85]